MSKRVLGPADDNNNDKKRARLAAAAAWITDLPAEMRVLIAGFLCYADVTAMLAAHKAWQGEREQPALWRYLVETHFLGEMDRTSEPTYRANVWERLRKLSANVEWSRGMSGTALRTLYLSIAADLAGELEEALDSDPDDASYHATGVVLPLVLIDYTSGRVLVQFELRYERGTYDPDRKENYTLPGLPEPNTEPRLAGIIKTWRAAGSNASVGDFLTQIILGVTPYVALRLQTKNEWTGGKEERKWLGLPTNMDWRTF